jgi:hypothetical protein
MYKLFYYLVEHAQQVNWIIQDVSKEGNPNLARSPALHIEFIDKMFPTQWKISKYG